MMSMMSYLAEMMSEDKIEVKLVYTFRVSDSGDGESEMKKVLFGERLVDIFNSGDFNGEFILHRTSGEGKAKASIRADARVGENVEVKHSRITDDDVLAALGTVEERPATLCYICGVPSMTDHFVEVAGKAEGMDRAHVMCEKWW